jgi:hypothetical protein
MRAEPFRAKACLDETGRVLVLGLETLDRIMQNFSPERLIVRADKTSLNCLNHFVATN